MKKFIQWLAKIFNANIVIEKTVYKYLDYSKEGDIKVEGNLTVKGNISATRDIVCYKSK